MGATTYIPNGDVIKCYNVFAFKHWGAVFYRRINESVLDDGLLPLLINWPIPCVFVNDKNNRLHVIEKYVNINNFLSIRCTHDLTTSKVSTVYK